MKAKTKSWFKDMELFTKYNPYKTLGNLIKKWKGTFGNAVYVTHSYALTKYDLTALFKLKAI